MTLMAATSSFVHFVLYVILFLKIIGYFYFKCMMHFVNHSHFQACPLSIVIDGSLV